MANFYLLAYNTGLCIAWGYILYLTLDVGLREKGGVSDLWEKAALPLKIAQTAAVLEVVHSAVGLVRSPVFITATQVASRLWILWGIILLVEQPTTTQTVALAHAGGVPLSLSLFTLLGAWSASEIIRYSFYAFKEALGYVPYPSLWLRYTGFIVLYPLGVASELAMVYLAWPTIKSQRLWSFYMPNKFNFSFDYALVCLAVSVGYVPGLYSLYTYMLRQRGKALSGTASKNKVPDTVGQVQLVK